MLSAEQKQRLCSAFAALCRTPENGETREAVYGALWDCVTACEGCAFETVTGLPFTYSIKMTRSGAKGSELCISRKEKTVTRSSILLSLDRLARLAQGEFPVKLTTPKQLGTFGASYILPLFIRFGLVQFDPA